MATNRPPSKRVREGRNGILDVPLRNRDHDIRRRATARLIRSIRNPFQRIKLTPPNSNSSTRTRLIGQHRPSEFIGFLNLSRRARAFNFPHGYTKRAYPHCVSSGLFRRVAILIRGMVFLRAASRWSIPNCANATGAGGSGRGDISQPRPET
jgi:hypothetical protein